jgi:hypothetical protein
MAGQPQNIFRVLALRPVHDGETDEGTGHVRMVAAEFGLPDRERALVVRLRLGVLALALVHDGEIVEGCGHVGVVAAELRLLDR